MLSFGTEMSSVQKSWQVKELSPLPSRQVVSLAAFGTPSLFSQVQIPLLVGDPWKKQCKLRPYNMAPSPDTVSAPPTGTYMGYT